MLVSISVGVCVCTKANIGCAVLSIVAGSLVQETHESTKQFPIEREGESVRTK